MGEYYGLPTAVLSNPFFRLEYLTSLGPRIVRLTPKGAETNLLAEAPEFGWQTPYGFYFVRGGHRLWHAPETAQRTYVPDDDPISIEEIPNGVSLVQPVEKPTGIQKEIRIEISPAHPQVVLTHILTNQNLWPVELAPWAITQLQLGGLVVLPQQEGKLDQDGLQANRHLVLWPYTRWDDPRLKLGEAYILVQAQPRDSQFKIGYFNRHGWFGYFYQEWFFCKRFIPRLQGLHPDFGSNVEVFSDHQFVELETLGPLERLEPGEKVQHREIWSLHHTGAMPATVDEAHAKIMELVF